MKKASTIYAIAVVCTLLTGVLFFTNLDFDLTKFGKLKKELKDKFGKSPDWQDNSPDQQFNIVQTINKVMDDMAIQTAKGEYTSSGRITDVYEWDSGNLHVKEQVRYDSLSTKVKVFILNK